MNTIDKRLLNAFEEQLRTKYNVHNVAYEVYGSLAKAILAMHDAGWSRESIAQALNVRTQHVYNVVNNRK